MTSCCVCFDLTAAIALLSCDNCRICLSCYQDLITEFTNATGISTLKCQCPNQSTIIINTKALSNPSLDSTVTQGHDSHDLVQNYRQSLTKTLKGLTNLTRKLQIFMSLRQKDAKLAPNRIRAMLRVQVSYLPANLVHQRTEELAKQLSWYNDSQIKAIQLEITAVSEWITVHNNLLAGVNVNTSQAYHHYTQNLRPLVVTAIKRPKPFNISRNMVSLCIKS